MRAKVLLAFSALAGALAGSAGTYVAIRAGESAPSSSAEPPAGGAGGAVDRIASAIFSRAIEDADAGPMSTLDRLELYEVVASSAASGELEALIQRVAARPPSPRRTFELDALLGRLAEHDVQRAVALAQTLRLETERVLPLFQLWAVQDRRAAIAALGDIDNPATARAIALGLLDVFGGDERGFAQLDTLFSAAQLRALRADALVLRSEHDPFAALQEAMTLPYTAARAVVIARIGQRWASRDPEAAIAQVGLIGDEQARTSYHSTVIAEWARLDPEAVLAYLRNVDTPQSLAVVLPALRSLTSLAEPDVLLGFAEELPTSMRSAARQMALQAFAERNPLAAIEILETVQSPAERETLVSAVANAYGRRDPDRALEWVRSLQPESPSAMMSVLSGIAAADPERAIELVLADESAASSRGSFALMGVFAQLQDTEQLAGLADRLIARDDFRASGQIRVLLSSWSAQDPQSAIEWVAANMHRIDRGTVQGIAAELAARDPESAIRALDRLPPERRSDWLTPVAAAYAQYDHEGAITWVMQYQGQTGFEAAVTAIAQRSAARDPQAALRLLERVGKPLEPQLAMQIAAGWAAQEPAAAADWANGLPAAMRDAAAGVIASSWSARDTDAARRWVLALPTGPARDQALGALLANALVTGGPDDTTIMNAFSSDGARQNALVRVVGLVAMRNRNEAQRLVETWVSDLSLRRQALEMIENSGNAPAMSFSPGGMISVPSGAIVRGPL